MSFDKFILDDDGKPRREPDLMKWAMWFETSGQKRVVAETRIGEVLVSTVFLGLDYGLHLFSKGSPVLWETMVFGGELDREIERCSGNKEQAEGMHSDMCERVQAVELLKH